MSHRKVSVLEKSAGSELCVPRLKEDRHLCPILLICDLNTSPGKDDHQPKHPDPLKCPLLSHFDQHLLYSFLSLLNWLNVYSLRISPGLRTMKEMVKDHMQLKFLRPMYSAGF